MSSIRKAEQVYYPGATNGGLPTATAEKPSQMEYTKKVLDWVCVQLAITAAFCFVTYSNRDSVIDYLAKNPGSVWFPVIVSFITLFCMYKTEDTETRKCMFFVFTFAMSGMVSVSVLQYSPDVVFKAVMTTAIMVFAINRYSKRAAERGERMDKMAEVGGSLLLVLIVVSILQIFIRSSILGLVICIMGIGIFTILLMADLNRIYQKDEDFQEDPMLAAIGIYLDIVNLFLYLLELYNRCEGKGN
jgi:FtsH-binding integral membrane protein